MSRRLVGVAVAGLAVAVAAESATYLPEEPALAAADASVGLAFVGLGVVAWQRRPASRSGLLMVATGFAWFAGSFAEVALFLHRGPLVHLLLGYPRGRLRSRLERVVVAARDQGLLLYSSTGHVDGRDGDLLMLGPPFSITDDDASAGTQFVDSSRTWFNSIWTTISRDYQA